MRWLPACLAMTMVCPEGASSAESAPPPSFELRIADGTTRAAPLIEIDGRWDVRLGEGKPAPAVGTEIVSLRQKGLAMPAHPGPNRGQILLANGSRLAGRLLAIADDRLQLRPSVDGDKADAAIMHLPVSAVSVVWLATPQGIAQPRSWLRQLLRDRRAGDVVWLRNGDRLEGTLLGMSDRGFRIRTEGNQQLQLLVSKVAVVAFNTELVSRARPKGIHGHLVLANGSRLLLASARLTAGSRTLKGQLPTGADLDVPVDQIVALDIRNGCAVELSDLKPSRYEHTSWSAGLSWPYGVDSSAAGGELRLADGTYDKGLGMHSKSRLSFSLGGNYRAFDALVGLDDGDDGVGRRGRPIIQVLLDDKPAILADRADAVELSWRDGPRRIRVDVADKQKLTLVVDFGRLRKDVQERVNWVESRLIRRTEKK
jgi:hypothetical protein